LEGLVVKTMVNDLHLKRVAIVFAQDDPAPVDTERAFETALRNAGVSIAAKIGYAKNHPDLGPQVRRLVSAQPQAVFAAAYSAEDAGSFLRQARDNGLDVPVVGSQTFNSPGVLQIAGAKAEPLIVGSQWFAGDPAAANRHFVDEFHSRFHAEPGTFAAMAYNGAMAIKAALEDSRDATRAGLLKGLASLTKVDGLGAPIVLKDRDASTDKPIMLTAKDGSFALYRQQG
jgi:branched-chain amino acid transport system substrate-binding protein